LPPSFDERIGLGMHLDDLRLELLLCSKEAVPEVVADRALLQQVLEGRFVLAYAKDALDVCDRPPHQCGFQRGIRSGGVGTLKESDIGVSLDVSWEIRLDLFAGVALPVESTENEKATEYDEDVKDGNKHRGHGSF